MMGHMQYDTQWISYRCRDNHENLNNERLKCATNCQNLFRIKQSEKGRRLAGAPSHEVGMDFQELNCFFGKETLDGMIPHRNTFRLPR